MQFYLYNNKFYTVRLHSMKASLWLIHQRMQLNTLSAYLKYIDYVLDFVSRAAVVGYLNSTNVTCDTRRYCNYLAE